MPAKSQAQQKFMGMVHAAQKGEKPASKAVAKVAKDMPKKAAKDFASTKHKGLPKKVKEATDTVEKDEKGNVKSWKHEGDWKKTDNKQGRGKVTNLSDKARRQTMKMGKEKQVAEEMPVITQGANKGKKWTQDNPGITNPNFPKGGIDKSGIPSPPDGATATPSPVKPAKSEKKVQSEARANTASARAGLAKRKSTVPLSKEEQAAKDKAKSDKWLEKERAKSTKAKTNEGWTHDTLAAKLFEHEDDQQPDDESKMAKSELLAIAENAMLIFKAIKDNENLDAWITSYISVASDHLNNIAEAMQGEDTIDNVEISADDDYFESLNSRLRNQLKG